MKRSDFFIRLTTGVLFLAVASYIGVYIYNALINTFVTATAIAYAVEETFPAYGYIVRTETVLTDDGATVMPVVGEGERVASGQAVAVEYTSSAAVEAAAEIRALRLRIAQLETSGGGGQATSHARVMNLASAVQSGDLSNLDEIALDIGTFVFSGANDLPSDLPALRARLDSLERRNEGIRTIHAPFSGTFSQVVDGFEHIEPGDLSEIMPSGLADLFANPYDDPGVGKLVTEFKWYFAAVMDLEDAMRMSSGRHITVQFSGAYNTAMDMFVESIGRREDGECVVIFSSDRSIHDVAPLRQLRADIVNGVVSGIRVPREAIHLDDDGTPFVFLQTGVRAERVDVDILLETGDSYLVRDGLDAGTPLRSGATIIVRANNLYDGKVVA